jgi:hypothetical protein
VFFLEFGTLVCLNEILKTMFRKCTVGLLAVFFLHALTGASCLPLFYLPNIGQQDSEAIAFKALLVIAYTSHSDESLSVSLTGSTGIATVYSQLDRNSGTLLKRADDALYLAKNKGQNQVQFSSKINASEVNVLIVDALTVNAS